MALQNYSGRTIQKVVTVALFPFEADIDLAAGSNKCSCSICTKARAWFVFVDPDRFRLTAGADAQAEYQCVPPGHSESDLHYRFCKTCGIRTAGRGEYWQRGGAFYFVPIASLDDADPGGLAAAPIGSSTTLRIYISLTKVTSRSIRDKVRSSPATTVERQPAAHPLLGSLLC